MTHIKDILQKKTELLTDEDKAKVQAHFEEYATKILELSQEYGLEVFARLNVNAEAITPNLSIRIIPTKTGEALQEKQESSSEEVESKE